MEALETQSGLFGSRMEVLECQGDVLGSEKYRQSAKDAFSEAICPHLSGGSFVMFALPIDFRLLAFSFQLSAFSSSTS